MPKKVDHKLRREAFLAAAYRTIKKKGIAGVTVRAVAHEAGFTTGALVHYVESMDRLLAEASEYAARYVRADMELMEQLPDKLEALRQVVHLSLPLDEDKRGNWNFWVGFWERSIHNAAVRKLTQTRYREWLKRVERLIRNAQASHDIPAEIDAHKQAKMCVAVVDGIATQTLRSGFPLTPAEQCQMIDDWIVGCLHPTRSLGPASGERRRRQHLRGARAAITKAN
ncbi:MAG: TetR family transcriptional regulator C-terminal domain-containing protein [Rhizomicrobium sp.]|jgi:AcrR family transcriptional regulator